LELKQILVHGQPNRLAIYVRCLPSGCLHHPHHIVHNCCPSLVEKFAQKKSGIETKEAKATSNFE